MTSSPKWVCLCIEEEWDVRLCVDMRKANTAIIRNYYPIPTLDEVLYEVNGAKILSKLDLVEVYYKIVLMKIREIWQLSVLLKDFFHINV